MPADFYGWATKNNLLCSDGTVICEGAFKIKDGERVPLVDNHNHASIMDVIGHAFLFNKPEGIWAEGYFNETEKGKAAKTILQHGDIDSLSIFAVNVESNGNKIVHGDLKELSVVLAGANPGAYIESIAHSGFPMDFEQEDEGVFYTGDKILLHAEDGLKKKEEKKDEGKKDKEESDSETIGDVLNTMTENQKVAVAYMVKEYLDAQSPSGEPEKKEEKKEDKTMSHNLFKQSDPLVKEGEVKTLTHSEIASIFEDAKRLGSLREAVRQSKINGVLAHAAIPTDGMTVATGTSTYGVNDMDMLFPDPTPISNRPEWLKRNTTWVQKWMSKVHRTPYSRLKMMFADITEDEARAKGYVKGNQKMAEVFSLLKRTISPTTIYKVQKFDRDDIVDLGNGFSFIAWIREEMEMMIDEEKARAQLIGDGRLTSSKDKIDENCIIPVIKEAPLFNVVVKVKVPADADEATVANAVIKAVIKNRKKYKGSGRPTFWTTEDYITEMLLLENKISDRYYKTELELATALRVDEVVPVEPMEGVKVEISEAASGGGTIKKEYPLIGVVVNPADYNVGNDPLGKRNFFDDFDLNYNQQLYLLEERLSGALIKPFSALTFVLDRSEESGAALYSSTKTKVE